MRRARSGVAPVRRVVVFVAVDCVDAVEIRRDRLVAVLNVVEASL